MSNKGASLLVFWVFLVCVLAPMPSSLLGSELFYTYRNGNGLTGGVALIKIDKDTGFIRRHTVVCEDGRLALAKKVRFNKKANRLAITNESEKKPFVLLCKPTTPSLAAPSQIDTLCDEIRSIGDNFIATCDKGKIVLLDGKSGKILKTFKAKTLDPPGNRPEDVCIVEKRNLAVVTFQKDSSSGNKRGNRVVGLSLDKLKLQFDVLIPRDQPALHVPGYPKLSGPGPEVVLVSEKHNQVLVTCDFYGTVSLFELNESIKDPLRKAPFNIFSFSVARDHSYGTAFPDRATFIDFNGQDKALIVNAGKSGGANLLRFDFPMIEMSFNTPPGLEAPIFMPSVNMAVSICSGKTKFRKGNENVKEYHPNKKLYAFTFDEGADYSLLSHNLGFYGKAIEAVDPESSPLAVVASKDRIFIVDVTSGEILDKVDSIGIPQRIIRK